jgi:hypothetical protein
VLVDPAHGQRKPPRRLFTQGLRPRQGAGIEIDVGVVAGDARRGWFGHAGNSKMWDRDCAQMRLAQAVFRMVIAAFLAALTIKNTLFSIAREIASARPESCLSF